MVGGRYDFRGISGAELQGFALVMPVGGGTEPWVRPDWASPLPEQGKQETAISWQA